MADVAREVSCPGDDPEALPQRRCVVVTYNSATTIEECLRSLEGESVIVIDNASSDDTVARVEAAGGNVRIVRLHENHGFARAANFGFEIAAPADVVLLNPDAIPAPGALDRLARTALAHNAGLVAPRLLYGDGTIQESARTFPSVVRLLARRTALERTALGRRVLEQHLGPMHGDELRDVDWVMGAAMYIPRSTLVDVGPFDERFFLYAEDVDLCTRLWRAGRPVLLDPAAEVSHHYTRASKRTLDLRKLETRQHWLSILRLAVKYPAAFWLGSAPRHGAHVPLAPVAPVATPRRGPQRERLAGRPHLRGEIPLPLLALERTWQMIRLYENWPLAIADRLGLVRGRQVVYSVRRDFGSARLVARANGCDVRTITEVWVGELYTNLLDPQTYDGDTPVVVDIGANCGYFAVYAARRLPGAHVVCFEPEPENRRLAAINLELNGIDAEVRGAAVVAHSAPTAVLNLSDDPRLHTTIDEAVAHHHGIATDRYTGNQVSVPAANINDALRGIMNGGRLAVVKIDVEGLDLDLVAAIDDDVLRRTDYLVAETEARDTLDVSTKLADAGFAVYNDTNLLLAMRTSDGSG